MIDPDKIYQAWVDTRSVSEVQRRSGISRNTIYKILRLKGVVFAVGSVVRKRRCRKCRRWYYLDDPIHTCGVSRRDSLIAISRRYIGDATPRQNDGPAGT